MSKFNEIYQKIYMDNQEELEKLRKKAKMQILIKMIPTFIFIIAAIVAILHDKSFSIEQNFSIETIFSVEIIFPFLALVRYKHYKHFINLHIYYICL